MKKIWYLGKIRKLYTFCSKVPPPPLNAWFFLLEHQWGFEPSVIVAYESLSCPQCEKMDLKIMQSLFERVQIHKNAGKPKNLWSLKDFFLKNSKQFNCSGQTRESSWTTITKQKNTAVDHSGKNTVLRINLITFEQGHFYKCSYYFLLWTICKHSLYEISYSGQF